MTTMTMTLRCFGSRIGEVFSAWLRARAERQFKEIVGQSDFARDADFSLPTEQMRQRLEAAVAPDAAAFVDATRLASTLTTPWIHLGPALCDGRLPNGPALGASIDRMTLITSRRLTSPTRTLKSCG